MTPEATYALCHLADRFGLMVLHLLREPLPPLPAQRGRVIAAPKPPTPEEDAERLDAEVQAARIWRELASDTEGGSHD